MNLNSYPNENAIRYTNFYTLHASATETTSGQSASSFDVSNFSEALLIVDTTAVSGTNPSITFTLQTQDPLTGKWADVPTPSAMTVNAVSTKAFAITNYGRVVRLNWTISGTTPSFTFSASLVVKS